MTTTPAAPEPRLRPGLKVFVVEDESLVAMQLEDMIEELGCELVGLAMRINKAMELLNGGIEMDVAILDVNVGGERVFPLAEIVRQRNIPIIFATGYGKGGLDPIWHDCQILQKPYTLNEVAERISAAVAA